MLFLSKFVLLIFTLFVCEVFACDFLRTSGCDEVGAFSMMDPPEVRCSRLWCREENEFIPKCRSQKVHHVLSFEKGYLYKNITIGVIQHFPVGVSVFNTKFMICVRVKQGSINGLVNKCRRECRVKPSSKPSPKVSDAPVARFREFKELYLSGGQKYPLAVHLTLMNHKRSSSDVQFDFNMASVKVCV